MNEDFEIVNQQELREQQLIQLLAVFIRRFGGEVTITAREFGMVEGIDIFARQVTPEHLKLTLDDIEIVIDAQQGPEEG